jgi:hypothetical protein
MNLAKVLDGFKSPPDRAIDLLEWRAFMTDVVSTTVILLVLIVISLTCLYWRSARRGHIHSPDDVFKHYKPMNWQFLAWVPGVGIAIFYWHEFTRRFADAPQSWIGGAMGMLILTTLLTWVLLRLLMWMPKVTPAKFRYRPRKEWL